MMRESSAHHLWAASLRGSEARGGAWRQAPPNDIGTTAIDPAADRELESPPRPPSASATHFPPQDTITSLHLASVPPGVPVSPMVPRSDYDGDTLPPQSPPQPHPCAPPANAFCWRCGGALPPYAVFCMTCGARVQPGAPPHQHPPPHPSRGTGSGGRTRPLPPPPGRVTPLRPPKPEGLVSPSASSPVFKGAVDHDPQGHSRADGSAASEAPPGITLQPSSSVTIPGAATADPSAARTTTGTSGTAQLIAPTHTLEMQAAPPPTRRATFASLYIPSGLTGSDGAAEAQFTGDGPSQVQFECVSSGLTQTQSPVQPYRAGRRMSPSPPVSDGRDESAPARTATAASDDFWIDAVDAAWARAGNAAESVVSMTPASSDGGGVGGASPSPPPVATTSSRSLRGPVPTAASGLGHRDTLGVRGGGGAGQQSTLLEASQAAFGEGQTHPGAGVGGGGGAPGRGHAVASSTCSLAGSRRVTPPRPRPKAAQQQQQQQQQQQPSIPLPNGHRCDNPFVLPPAPDASADPTLAAAAVASPPRPAVPVKSWAEAVGAKPEVVYPDRDLVEYFGFGGGFGGTAAADAGGVSPPRPAGLSGGGAEAAHGVAKKASRSPTFSMSAMTSQGVGELSVSPESSSFSVVTARPPGAGGAYPHQQPHAPGQRAGPPEPQLQYPSSYLLDAPRGRDPLRPGISLPPEYAAPFHTTRSAPADTPVFTAASGRTSPAAPDAPAPYGVPRAPVLAAVKRLSPPRQRSRFPLPQQACTGIPQPMPAEERAHREFLARTLRWNLAMNPAAQGGGR